MLGNGVSTPVIAGLAVGMLFVGMMVYIYENGYPTFVPGVSRGFEFNIPNQLPEVKYLFSKYPNLITPGYHNDGRWIQFDYGVQKAVDTDGDGFNETIHRLDLFLLYDESNGYIVDNPSAPLLSMNATCTEPSPNNVYEWINVEQPARDGKVMDYMSNSKCIY